VNVDLTDEQRMLKETIAAYMRREAPPDKITQIRRNANGYDAGLYRDAAELGWLGILVPERYGGLELSLTDCAVAYEEFGRGPLPGPLFSSGVLGALILLTGGSADQQEAFLPAMVRGETRFALAAMDSGLGWGPALVESRLTRRDGRFTLDGVKPYVHDAEPADVFIVAARTDGSEGDGISLVLVDRSKAGVAVRRQTGLLTGIAEVRFDSVDVEDDAVIGSVGSGWELLERATERAIPILCAYMVGACQDIFDFTLDYSRERMAFGQAIGRFQRVQDHIVELANQMDAARWVTHDLLRTLETGSPATAAVHEAKAVASEAYVQVCDYAHMVHAGPGTDLDHPLMSHTLVSRSLYQFLGDPAHHKRRMMDLLFPPQRATARLS
jgi:alkylation response protein AidB-like acyl-CoA dehydrogenase